MNQGAGIEIELVHDILIALLILTFALTIFASATTQTLNTGNANINHLNKVLYNINQSGTNLVQSLNQTLVTENSVDTFYILEVAVNVGYKFVGFVIAIIGLVITDIGSVVIIFWEIIPGILTDSALGSTFGSIFALIYATAITILSLTFVYIILIMLGYRKTTG